MPITVSFDIEEDSIKDKNDRARITVAFLRFGWEHVGGSSWRYPKLGTQPVSEDWFNQVIPALMYLRSIVEHSGMNVYRFTVDAHSEAGHRGDVDPSVGIGILDAGKLPMSPTGLWDEYENKLSENRLRKFVADSAASLK